jgi:L-rhamnose isomerase
MNTDRHLQQSYKLAQERFASLGVDTEKVLRQLTKVPVSLQCWQGDDVEN